MTQVEKKAKKLREWILLEAYKNGQARRVEICPAGSSAAEGPEQYYVSRYAVYQRFFKLPIDDLFQGGDDRGPVRRTAQLRLRCSLLLCESVRALLREKLIWFPHRRSAKEDPTRSLPTAATLIFLTAAGARKAESLLFQPRNPPGRVNMADQAWDQSAL
jgi:hypothetical protein